MPRPCRSIHTDDVAHHPGLDAKTIPHLGRNGDGPAFGVMLTSPPVEVPVGMPSICARKPSERSAWPDWTATAWKGTSPFTTRMPQETVRVPAPPPGLHRRHKSRHALRLVRDPASRRRQSFAAPARNRDLHLEPTRATATAILTRTSRVEPGQEPA